jgi:hypothetical protein
MDVVLSSYHGTLNCGSDNFVLGAIKDDRLGIFELNKLLGSIWALSNSLHDFGKLRVIDVGHHNIRYEM